MLPEERGADSERRFFRALGERVSTTPDWFRRIKITKPSIDIRGVDAVAYILPKDQWKSTKVPIQVKSSDMGEWLYRLEMPELQRKCVIGVVITPRMSDDEIRQLTYSLLKPVHESGVRFGPFWTELMTQTFRAKKRRELIALSLEQRRRAESD